MQKHPHHLRHVFHMFLYTTYNLPNAVTLGSSLIPWKWKKAAPGAAFLYLFLLIHPSVSLFLHPSLGYSHIGALGEAGCWISLLDGSELWFTSLSSAFGGLRLFLGQDQGHVPGERASRARLLCCHAGNRESKDSLSMDGKFLGCLSGTA